MLATGATRWSDMMKDRLSDFRSRTDRYQNACNAEEGLRIKTVLKINA